MPHRYFKRRWTESRGDEHDSWGASTWFFEVDDQGHVLRQVELYDEGQRLRYESERYPSDRFGALSEKPLDLNVFAPFEIDASEFDATWSHGRWTNA